MGSGLSAGLRLIPCLEGGKFFDLIHVVVKTFPILVLEGIQLCDAMLDAHHRQVPLGAGASAQLALAESLWNWLSNG